nr:translocation/assembly module TamB domain-containing protein [Stutzerimonas sp. S1]
MLTLLLLLGVALGGVLGTTAGSRWLLQRVPGLQVEGFAGHLAGRWQAERLLWQQGEQRVELLAPRFAWSPGCLLRLTLCIDELVAEDVQLHFPPGAEATDSAPFSLPDIRLPLALRVERIELGRVRLNDVEQVQGLQLRADWRGEGLDIQALHLRRADGELQLRGRLQPSGAWPLALVGEAQLGLIEGRPWTLALRLDGELRDRLALTVDSRGYLDGTLSGYLQPLAEHLPATLRLQAEGFRATPELPDSLRLDAVELTASGDLQDGYRLLGNAELPGEGGVVRLALDGLLKASGATLEVLELDAGDGQYVRLHGQLDWQQALAGEANLAWRNFPWQRLYPLAEPPPVSLRELDAQLQYDDGAYLGHFESALSGPAGDFSLDSPLSGNLEVVHLPQLQLRAGQGAATGSLSVGFADGVDWKANLQLSELDPAYWLAQLPGQLGGTLRSRGALRDETLQAEAELDLAGQLRGQPSQLQLSAAGLGTNWDVPRLDLRVGANRIHGSGHWSETLDGELRVQLPRLAQLWPGLRGQLDGLVQLAGTAAAPQGSARLNGQTLAYQANRVERLRLDAALGQGERATLRLVADALQLGDNDMGNLQLDASGTRARHQAGLQLDGPTLDFAAALDGSLQDADWQGHLLRATLQAHEQRWALQSPAAIRRRADGRVELGAHCWRDAPASLCAEEQRLLPEPQLRYRLRDFPLDSLAGFFPEDFAWQGELNADLRLDLPEAGPNGELRIDAGAGVLRLRDGEAWHDFPYRTLTLDSRLRPERIDSQLRFDGGELGEVDVSTRIDPRRAIKPLEGEFRLRGLDLAVARPFAPMVERLQGELNGSGRLAGSLHEPELQGELRLSGGELAGSELPVTLEQLQARLLIDGQQLRIDGDWRSGEQGRGALSGTLDWHAAPGLDLRLKGERLPVVVEPYADLEVDPDLSITLADEQLAISGRVLVPRGAITVRELPPATVKVSEDAVIVGAEGEPANAPLAVKMDIDVEVGQERLRFAGFGLTADLAGYLHIGDNLNARGELNLNNGRYRAYGQRLSIRRARLLFTGVLTQPYLDIEAIRRVEAHDVIAGLRISGSAEQPRVDVFAEPAMSQEQALSYLVLGRPLGADSGDSNLLAQAALGLGLAGSASITGGLAQRLGIEEFQLDTEGSGAATSVVASGRLSERLTLRYGVGVFESSNTIALRYQLTRRLFLEAASGLASSLDLFYRRDF